ncbi:DUF58 domain-containing protein [Fimbriiglobus ruber]|uniref:DUF58 domain-containing protein n=1 Tax=Fimbriiglobus ruber TaxID=1908690 RepID=A0A225E3P1_9BACT|nr:DUF58 domain-containing protein [Fimbriiglobus ruber]OWK46374.1 hypothetical protein FRUB_00073 [Fimbriiglobus ruber]
MPDSADPTVPTTKIRLTRTAAVWFLVSVLLAVVGWYKTINLILLLGYTLVALLGVNGWLAWRTTRRVAGRRHPVTPVFPGEEAVATSDLTNSSQWPVTAKVTDRSRDKEVAWLVTPISPGETLLVTARWSFPARGRYPLGPMMIDASYPFGVIHATRPIAEPGSVLVLPSIGRIDLDMFRRWLIRGGAGDGQSRRPARGPATGRGDVRGVRPYRAGDAPRDIHWKTSARRNQLLVREYDRPEPLDLVIAVDPWAPAGAPAVALQRVEWVLSLAATLGRAWCESDDPADLTLIVPGTPPVIRTGRGTPAFVRHAFECLAELSGTPNVPVVPPGLARRRSNRSARLLVSTRAVSPLAAAFRSGGVPFSTIDPSAAPAWFVPPPEAAVSGGRWSG